MKNPIGSQKDQELESALKELDKNMAEKEAEAKAKEVKTKMQFVINYYEIFNSLREKIISATADKGPAENAKQQMQEANSVLITPFMNLLLSSFLFITKQDTHLEEYKALLEKKLDLSSGKIDELIISVKKISPTNMQYEKFQKSTPQEFHTTMIAMADETLEAVKIYMDKYLEERDKKLLVHVFSPKGSKTHVELTKIYEAAKNELWLEASPLLTANATPQSHHIHFGE